MTNATFSSVFADWINNTIVPTIPEKANIMRGVAMGISAIIKVRHNYLTLLIQKRFPIIADLGIFGEEVDAEALTLGILPLIREIKEYNIAEVIPRFTYNVTEVEIKRLCDALNAHKDS